jgi:hypothetical protein
MRATVQQNFGLQESQILILFSIFLFRFAMRTAVQQNFGLQESQMRIQVSPGGLLSLHHDQRGKKKSFCEILIFYESSK